DTFLFDQVKRRSLDWQKRCNIILGIARGLLYLHEDSQLRLGVVLCYLESVDENGGSTEGGTGVGNGNDGGDDESERRSSEWRSHVQRVGRLQMQSREMLQQVQLLWKHSGILWPRQLHRSVSLLRLSSSCFGCLCSEYHLPLAMTFS
ncbi:hypothetical protein NA695_23350, partial [Salmonella sp. NW3]|uniref:hypothetical protein n=1 Tax=Salmonella sp. NW3 TaxID=2947879 RepID=UPI003F4377AA